MSNATYTAPAVIACTDAVQNTKQIGQGLTDNGPFESVAPGSVGFSL